MRTILLKAGDRFKVVRGHKIKRHDKKYVAQYTGYPSQMYRYYRAPPNNNPKL